MTSSDEQAGRSAPQGLEGAWRFAADKVGVALTSPLTWTALIPGLGSSRRGSTPGASPGVEQLAAGAQPPDPATVRISVMEYGPAHCDERVVRIDHLADELQKPLADGARTRWINIDGLSPYLVLQFKEIYGLHTLAAEDVLHVPQRPKAEVYDDQLFVLARMISLRDERLHLEQISFFLLPGGTLLTFQEDEQDVWEPVRARIRKGIPRFRESGADYLLYALLDALVDYGFPLLERYGDELETLESQIIESAHQAQLGQLHRVKRELALLRRVLWPTRDLVDNLCRGDHALIQDETRTFLRDVSDHSMQLLDVIETYRETMTSLSDLYINAASQRMNEIMKTLTIMASIFIPITFLAGVFGMNFEHMPELDEPWGYPMAWSAFIAVAVGLLLYFRRKRWF